MTNIDFAFEGRPSVTFVFPRSRGDISGGHLYNERLCAAIGRISNLKTIQIDGLAGELRTGTQGAFVFDSLDLFDVALDAYRTAGRVFAVIVHYLPSMGSGDAANDAQLERERAALSQFDRFVTTGVYSTQYLVQMGFEGERIIHVPPPCPRYGAIRHPSPPPLRAVVVANVLEQKGIRELLECLKAGITESDSLSLEIVGRLDAEPEYVAECLQLAAAPSLSGRVHFFGAVAPERVVAHYQRANLCVSASKIETFGMALQEARAAGLPLLVLDGGNARHHVSDGAGEVVSSTQELVTRLLELCRAPEQLRTMSERAERVRTAGEAYDWDSAARTLLTALTSG